MLGAMQHIEIHHEFTKLDLISGPKLMSSAQLHEFTQDSGRAFDVDGIHFNVSSSMIFSGLHTVSIIPS